MPMKPYRSSIRDILSKPGLEGTDVGWLMVCIRRLLEETGRQKAYNFLNLYCNWVAHSKLSRSKLLFELLANLSKIIGKYSTDEFNPAWGKAMTEALGTKKLRDDLRAFSKEYGYPDQFWGDDNSWRGFLGLLSQVIMDVPIAFPDESKMTKSEKDHWESAKTSICGQDARVRDLRLTEVDNRVCWEVTLEFENPPKPVTLRDTRGLLL